MTMSKTSWMTGICGAIGGSGAPKVIWKNTPFCIHKGTRPRDCNPKECCWRRGRGCLMKHYSSSSSVGAVIIWVLLALLLLGGGLLGGFFVVKMGTRKNAGEVTSASDDE